MKILKSRIFTFFLGAIIFSSVTAFAAKKIINSEDVLYDRNNNTSNVKEAINNLYDTLSEDYYIKGVTSYSSRDFIEYQIQLPYMTPYTKMTIEKAYLDSGTISSFAVRCANKDILGLRLSSTPVEYDVSSIQGDNCVIIMYARNTTSWGASGVLGISLTRETQE